MARKQECFKEKKPKSLVACEALSKGPVACFVSYPTPSSHWGPTAIVCWFEEMDICFVSWKMFSIKHFAKNSGSSQLSDSVCLFFYFLLLSFRGRESFIFF